MSREFLPIIPNFLPNKGPRHSQVMRTSTYDERTLERFKAEALSVERWRGYGPTCDSNELPLHVLEWDRDVMGGAGAERIGRMLISELQDTGNPQVRIVFAPRDIALPETVNGMVELFVRFGVPGAFVAEGLQGVSQSFGTCRKEKDTEYVWFHLLSKDVAVAGQHMEPERHSGFSADDASFVGEEEAGLPSALYNEDFSQANYTWMKPAIVFKIDHDEELPSHGARRITLLLFGAPSPFWDRFQCLIGTHTADDLLEDPFMLMEIVFDEMHKLMDRVGWHVADVFRTIEQETLGQASTPVKAGEGISFTRLHNLLKHTIFLRENCDGAINTIENLSAYHETYITRNRMVPELSAQDMLKYRKTIFQSTQGRLVALDQRMTNMLELSFHLVTQRDSRIMQSEALSMKMIAVVTLIFVPLGTVAAVFGAQLINMEDKAPFRVHVSQDFWLLWVIAIPLTCLVMLIWGVWYRKERAQLRDETPRVPAAERSDMGWNRLKASFLGGGKEHKQS